MTWGEHRSAGVGLGTNPNVSTVILGASSVERLRRISVRSSALKALEDADLKAKMGRIFAKHLRH